MRHAGKVKRANGEEVAVTFAVERLDMPDGSRQGFHFRDTRTENGERFEGRDGDELFVDFPDVLQAEMQELYPGCDVEVTRVAPSLPHGELTHAGRIRPKRGFIARHSHPIACSLLLALLVSAIAVGGFVYLIIVEALVFVMLAVLRKGERR